MKLIGEVFLNDFDSVFWSKNGEKLYFFKFGEKYLEVSCMDLLLIIFIVNEYDVGFYYFIVINVVGLI